VFDKPEELSTETSPTAETSLLPDPPSEPTLTETPVEAPPGVYSNGSAEASFVRKPLKLPIQATSRQTVEVTRKSARIGKQASYSKDYVQ